MPNKNYIRGVRWEREVMAELKALDQQAIIMRASGSHGEYDVMAYLPSLGQIFLIQCKTKVVPKARPVERDGEGSQENVKVVRERWTKYVKG